MKQATGPEVPSFAAKASIAPSYWLAFAGILAVAVAWAIYHPEETRPFDILDFGEFLPFLKGTNDFSEQVASLIRYNATQSGRANLMPIVASVLKWTLFGMWVPGWQLTRALVLLVLMLQTFQLSRHLGATRLGGLVAASTYLFAPAAARGWVRLTMGEPMAMIVILALTLRALRYQQTPQWRREVVLLCAGAVFVLLTKELLAPVILLPVAFALARQPDGNFAVPGLSRRNVTLVVAVGIASLATLTPLVLLFLNASPSAFSSQYGQAIPSFQRIVVIWIATLVPFTMAPSTVSVMWTMAVAGFLLVITAGWWIGWHDRAEGRRGRWLLTGSLLFPLLGALSYAPWPGYEERYGFPYLVGTSLLLGLAASYLQRASPAGGRWAVLGWGAASVFGLAGAAALAARAYAVQRASDAVVSLVAAQPGVDTVLFATATRPVLEWTGLGPTFARLALATDRPWPPTQEIRCEKTVERLRTQRKIAIVAFTSHCRGEVRSVKKVVARFRRMEWSQWRLVGDSVRADIFTGMESIDTSTALQHK